MDPALIESLSAIEPYLRDVVLVGGWVPTVYVELHHPAYEGATLKTRDIDIAVPRALNVRSRTIGELLEANGFECEMSTTEIPPVMHFVARRARRGGGRVHHAGSRVPRRTARRSERSLCSGREVRTPVAGVRVGGLAA